MFSQFFETKHLIQLLGKFIRSTRIQYSERHFCNFTFIRTNINRAYEKVYQIPANYFTSLSTVIYWLDTQVWERSWERENLLPHILAYLLRMGQNGFQSFRFSSGHRDISALLLTPEIWLELKVVHSMPYFFSFQLLMEESKFQEIRGLALRTQHEWDWLLRAESLASL